MSEMQKFFWFVDEIQGQIGDSDGLVQVEDLRRLLSDLYFLHQPYVVETKELIATTGWDPENRRVRKQIARIAMVEQDSKVESEDKFNTLRDMQRGNKIRGSADSALTGVYWSPTGSG